jgi:hypothetical protein
LKWNNRECKAQCRESIHLQWATKFSPCLKWFSSDQDLIGVTWPGGRDVTSHSYHIRTERRGDPAEQAASPYMGMSRVHCDVIPTAYHLSAAYNPPRKIVEVPTYSSSVRWWS